MLYEERSERKAGWKISGAVMYEGCDRDHLIERKWSEEIPEAGP
jgi:hypothetical protein